MRINKQITAPKVRLIDENGGNVGVIALEDALSMAERAGLDLVEISPRAEPPVCKILDYNKFLYDQKAKSKKIKSKKVSKKEFTLSPKIGEGDLRLRIRRGREFLESGNMVKYTVKFKGREMKYPEIGLTKLKIVQSELSDVSTVEREPQRKGRMISMTLMPKKQ